MAIPLSIIIPTLNEERWLPLLLSSIAEQEYEGHIQVIVVDGHSTDQTVNQARMYSPRLNIVVLDHDRDIGGQRNAGEALATYEYLLFLDADVRLPRHFLSRIMIRKGDCKVFVGQVFHLPIGNNFFDYLIILFTYVLVFMAWIAGTPVTVGDCILTTKTNHRSINGFREGAVLGEDTDYGLRSIKKGAKYTFSMRTYIWGSPRRARKIGRIKLMLQWSKSFLYVRKNGPILNDERFDYPVVRPTYGDND